MEISELEEKIFKVIDKNPWSLVATIKSDEKAPRLRIMSSNRINEYEIWFVTRKSSSKVKQIEDSSYGEIVFAPQGFIELVRMKGKFQVLFDEKTKKEMWPKVRDIPAKFIGLNGPEDEDFSFVKFIPSYIVYTNHDRNVPGGNNYFSIRFRNGEKIVKTFTGMR